MARLDPLPIDYATAGSRAGEIRRGIIQLVVIVVLITAAQQLYMHWAYLERVGAMYAQHQCLQYEIPAGQTVYDENGSAMAALGSTAHYAVSFQDGDLIPALVRTADCWNTVGQATWISTGPAHGVFATRYRSNGLAPFAVAFLHERQNSAGQTRLVCVEVAPRQRPGFIITVIEPRKWSEDQSVASFSGTMTVDRQWPNNTLTVWAGQADPDDPSHFTIDCQFKANRTTLDGRLLDDDSVILRPRQGWTEDDGSHAATVWHPEN